jgi:UPF0716 protein FxsA
VRFLAWFFIISIVELATFFWVEERIGLAWALGLAFLTAILGSVLIKRAGVGVIRQIGAQMDAGRLPARELTHGAAILVAGAFLITPGFLTDAIGFILLIPQVRDLIHFYVSKRLGGRFRVTTSTRGSKPGDVIDVEPLD